MENKFNKNIKENYLVVFLIGFLLISSNLFSQNKYKSSKKAEFILASWVSPKPGFDKAEWTKKIKDYKRLGISEILIEVKHLSSKDLEAIVKLSKKNKIKVHAWMWTFNRPGDTIANKHPEWYSVNRNGENSLEKRAYVDYYQWLSPFHPEARAHIKNNIRKLMKIKDLASIHLDYVRFVDVILPIALQPKYNLVQDFEMAEFDYGYHPIARQKFEELFGIDPIKLKNPSLNNEWRQFRFDAIASLVNEIVEMAHKKNVKITAAVFPYPELARHLVRQPWDQFNLDAAYPMIYNNFYNQNINWVGFATKKGVELNKFPIFTGLFTPSFKENPDDLKKAILIAKQNRAKGVSLFTVDALTENQKEVLIQLKNTINE